MISLSSMARMPSNYDPVSLDVALDRASRDGRPIMIYFGEDWWRACRILEGFFDTEKLRAVYKRNYHVVSAYVRAGENSHVAKKYNVRGFPTMVFLDAKGERLCRAFGGFNHQEDALMLDRYVQIINSDPVARAQQNERKACGRISL